MDPAVAEITPIGFFHSPFKQTLEAPRQATMDLPDSYIQLQSGQGFEQALTDLEGFERLWVIFAFHQKTQWRPMVQPPRGPQQKRGVFATRSPLRPNHLGLSCLQLVKIEGLRIWVKGSDLLDQTPIYDIKPYLPYCDSFPNSKTGWLEGIEKEKWNIRWSPDAEAQKQWLQENGVLLGPIVQNQLEYDPTNSERKRVYPANETQWVFAYRTWRVLFECMKNQEIRCVKISSGYSTEDLAAVQDPYNDKELHRLFNGQD